MNQAGAVRRVRAGLHRLAVGATVACLLSPVRVPAVEPDAARPLERIAAGSCIRQDRPQPIWQAVAAFRPDLLLLLGDNVYGDTEDMAVLRAKYDRLAADAGFAAVRAAVPIVAIWDDHDYGANDAGRDYPRRRESQQVFCDFFGVPAEAPLRRQEGIYRSVVLGPPGRRVQLICLDTRYHRSPLSSLPLAERVRGGGPYRPTDDPAATVLGEPQWAWLAAALREPAEIRLLLSSIQVASIEHHHEHWGNFPAERARLLRTIRAADARGVIVVSGDRHAAEISRIPAGPEALSEPLYELTASSLNQPRGFVPAPEPNSLRLGEVYGQPNFGTLEIDWGEMAARVTLAVRDLRGAVILSESLSVNTAAPPASPAASVP